MTLKGVKRLQIAAVILHLITAALCCLAFFRGDWIIPMLSSNLTWSDQVRISVVPALVSCVCSVVLSIVYLALMLRCRSAAGSKTIVTAMAIVLGLRAVAVSPALQTYLSYTINSYLASLSGDTLSLSSYLNSVLSLLTTPFRSTASILFLLSMGGFYGKGAPQPESDGTI